MTNILICFAIFVAIMGYVIMWMGLSNSWHHEKSVNDTLTGILGIMNDANDLEKKCNDLLIGCLKSLETRLDTLETSCAQVIEYNKNVHAIAMGTQEDRIKELYDLAYKGYVADKETVQLPKVRGG